MAKRDPEKTARNKIIAEIGADLKSRLPRVLEETGITTEFSLHGIYGGKFADYIDIKHEVIYSPDQFIAAYVEGFVRMAELTSPGSGHQRNLELLRVSPALQEYLYLFLRRTYLRYMDSLSRRRPFEEEASIWIGQNNADYGLLITPRFVKDEAKWENDKSEIRHAPFNYWTIGHILETGLVIPNKAKRIQFKRVEEYLDFFLNVLVRNSGSKYEYNLAEIYCEYALKEEHPRRLPLLIPEFRYGGIAKDHKYRLDFTVIDPFELNRYGFELSPWSTHGYLSKTKELSQSKINELARDNFEKEMRKHKDFFRRHGIVVLIYTDTDLKDLGTIWADIVRCLNPRPVGTQLKFNLVRQLLNK